MGRIDRFRRKPRRGLPWNLLILPAAALAAYTAAFDPRPIAYDLPATRSVPHVLNGGNAWTGSSGTALRWTGTELPSEKAGRYLTGTVSHVRDGDTIEIGGVPVRIANLDCAETGTAAGERATRRARVLAAGGTMRCSLEGRSSFDRVVGACILPDGRDFGDVLVAEGLCRRWH